MKALEAKYAKALFSVIQDEKQLSGDVQLLSGSRPLWSALSNPCVRPEEKISAVERILGESTHPAMLNLYRILCRRGKITLLPGILKEYCALSLDAENAAQALVRCARPMAQPQLDKLAQALCKIHGKARVDLDVQIEPSLLGGFVLQLGDMIYDKSGRGMLDRLGRSLKER